MTELEDANKPDEPREEKEDWHRRNGSLLRGVAIGVGIAFAVMTVFSMGVFVGQLKARFSLGWGQHYDRQFGGPPRMIPGGPRDFFGGHGAAGVVIKKDAKSLVIRGLDNAEKIILISGDTQIVKQRQEIELKDVKEDSSVVVIGSPDDKGRIEARLIRVLEGEAPFGKMPPGGNGRGGFLWKNGAPRPLLPS